MHKNTPLGYWERESLLRTTNITIVGAGIVGMSTALYLRRLRPNADIRIVERHPLAAGGSSRNAGFACFGSAGEWLDDLDTLGEQGLVDLVRHRAEGLRHLIDLLGEDALGLEWKGGWELFRSEDEPLAAQALQALPRLNDLLQPALKEVLSDIRASALDMPALQPDPSRATQLGASTAIHLPWEGMLHTGRMITAFHRALDAAHIQRLHGVTVRGWTAEPSGSGWILDTDLAPLSTEMLAICCNGFAGDLLPDLDVRPVPNRVLVLKGQPDALPEGTYHLDRGYLYMRSLRPGEYLFGGGRHWNLDLPLSGSANIESAWDQQLLKAAEDWIQGPLEVTHRWTGWLGVGDTREPLIGQTASGLHHAVRMGGMGVAIGTGIGHQLAHQMYSE